jgi:hypothetical protein
MKILIHWERNDKLTTDKLIEKGFSIVKYEDEDFYSRTISDMHTVQKLLKLTGEDGGQFDFDYVGVHCVLEIKPDFSFAQYLFRDIDTDGSWFTHDQLTVEEFEKIIDEI